MNKTIKLRESMLIMREFIELLEKTDLTGVKSLQDKLSIREKNERYLEALDNENKGIWILNNEGKNIFVNQTSAGLFGYKVEEIIGQYLFNFMDEYEQNEALNNFIKKNPDATEQVKFIMKNGKVTWLEISNQTLYDLSGKKLGRIAVMKRSDGKENM